VLTENLSATRDAAGNPSGTGVGHAIAKILNEAGSNTISAVRLFINGIDAIATYGPPTAWISAAKTSSYNWTQNSIIGRNDTPAALNQVPGSTCSDGLDRFGSNVANRVTGSIWGSITNRSRLHSPFAATGLAACWH
jgi:hypothetical protein